MPTTSPHAMSQDMEPTSQEIPWVREHTDVVKKTLRVTVDVGWSLLMLLVAIQAVIMMAIIIGFTALWIMLWWTLAELLCIEADMLRSVMGNDFILYRTAAGMRQIDSTLPTETSMTTLLVRPSGITGGPRAIVSSQTSPTKISTTIDRGTSPPIPCKPSELETAGARHAKLVARDNRQVDSQLAVLPAPMRAEDRKSKQNRRAIVNRAGSSASFGNPAIGTPIRNPTSRGKAGRDYQEFSWTHGHDIDIPRQYEPVRTDATTQMAATKFAETFLNSFGMQDRLCPEAKLAQQAGDSRVSLPSHASPTTDAVGGGIINEAIGSEDRSSVNSFASISRVGSSASLLDLYELPDDASSSLNWAVLTPRTST